MFIYPSRWLILGLGFWFFLWSAPGQAAATAIEEDIQSLDPASRSELVQEVVLKINNPPQKNSEPNPRNPGENATWSPKSANFLEPGIHTQSAWPGSKNYDYLDHPESAPAPQTSKAPVTQLPRTANFRETGSFAQSARPGVQNYDYLDHPESAPAPQTSKAPVTQLPRTANVREAAGPAQSVWPEFKLYRHVEHPESLSYIKIIRQEEDHLLITVGDVVYLSTPPLEGVRVNERFCVYKNISATESSSDWFEEIGQLKILEKDGQLTIGRIIAARDIIQKGDVVFLRNRL